MVRWRHNAPGREWERPARRMGPGSGRGPDQLPSNSASAAKRPNTRRPPAVVVSICALVASEQAHAAGRQVLEHDLTPSAPRRGCWAGVVDPGLIGYAECVRDAAESHAPPNLPLTHEPA